MCSSVELQIIHFVVFVDQPMKHLLIYFMNITKRNFMELVAHIFFMTY